MPYDHSTESLLSLDMSDRGLDHKDLEEIIQDWWTIPGIENAQYVNLSSNSLGLKLETGFSKILDVFPSALELDLSENNLLYFGLIDTLSDIFKSSLPKNLAILNVSNNDLNAAETGDKLARIFQNCPLSLRQIDLSNNNLYLMKEGELKKGLAKLPKNLRCIKLSNNHFEFMEKKDFVKAISGLHNTLTSVDLSNNGLDDNQVRAMLPMLRKSNVIEFNISDNPDVSTDVLVELQTILTKNAKSAQKKPRAGSYGFGSLSFLRDKSSSITSSIEEKTHPDLQGPSEDYSRSKIKNS